MRTEQNTPARDGAPFLVILMIIHGIYNYVNNIIGVDYMFEVENKFKNANVARTIRFTEPLFEQLNEIAAANDVSFNLLALQCCQYAMDNMKGNDKTAAE